MPAAGQRKPRICRIEFTPAEVRSSNFAPISDTGISSSEFEVSAKVESDLRILSGRRDAFVEAKYYQRRTRYAETNWSVTRLRRIILPRQR